MSIPLLARAYIYWVGFRLIAVIQSLLQEFDLLFLLSNFLCVCQFVLSDVYRRFNKENSAVVPGRLYRGQRIWKPRLELLSHESLCM